MVLGNLTKRLIELERMSKEEIEERKEIKERIASLYRMLDIVRNEIRQINNILKGSDT